MYLSRILCNPYCIDRLPCLFILAPLYESFAVVIEHVRIVEFDTICVHNSTALLSSHGGGGGGGWRDMVVKQ